MAKKTVVIAGAGPAGITAAHEILRHSDYKPVVFERSPHLGGLSRTHVYKGNRIDIGGHRFFSKSDVVMDWWLNLLPLQGAPVGDGRDALEAFPKKAHRQALPNETPPPHAEIHGQIFTVDAPDPNRVDEVMLMRSRISRILFGGQFFPYPLTLSADTLWKLGLFNSSRIGLSYVRSRLFPEEKEETLDTFLINRFGRRLYETFFRDYTEKVWGVPCHEIPSEWGAQRIKGLSLREAIANAVKRQLEGSQQNAEVETSLIERFYYPKLGPGQMWEVAAKKVRQAGGEIHVNTSVEGLVTEGQSVVAVKVRRMDGGATHEEEIPCDAFMSSMPIRHLARAFGDACPFDAGQVASHLQYRHFLTAGLLLSRLPSGTTGKNLAQELPDNWIYIQDQGMLAGRCQIFNNWSPYLVSDPNKIWIGLEYFLDREDLLWRASEDHVLELARREAEQVGLARAQDVEDGCVIRAPFAYPAYFGAYAQLDRVQDWVSGFENVALIGRNGLHRYNNQDHSMLSAMKAVENLHQGNPLGDGVWDINAERVYHEEKDAP
jgi:protoporphyrinogen oxidase